VLQLLEFQPHSSRGREGALTGLGQRGSADVPGDPGGGGVHLGVRVTVASLEQEEQRPAAPDLVIQRRPRHRRRSLPAPDRKPLVVATAGEAALTARREVPGLPVLILSRHVEQLYARELLGRPAWADPVGALTERERSMLALMAAGLSNTAIAARLFLSEGAISKYTTTIFARLGLAAADDTNRRVRAVLTYLGAVGSHDK
jgi:DNA-binding CsgD family transcriptional regulator